MCTHTLQFWNTATPDARGGNQTAHLPCWRWQGEETGRMGELKETLFGADCTKLERLAKWAVWHSQRSGFNFPSVMLFVRRPQVIKHYCYTERLTFKTTVNVRETCRLLGDWREAGCSGMPCWRNCLWYPSSRQAKMLGSSAQRQLMTYHRQIFVVLEGLCWKPSTVHLGESLGSRASEYTVSTTIFWGLGGQNPGEKQQPAGCRAQFHFSPRVSTGHALTANEVRNIWISARRGLVDPSHVDFCTPKSEVAGNIMNGGFLHVP